MQGTVTATLQPGDRLFVVGAGARLGRWTPTDGIEVTDGRFDLQAFPSEVLAFKLVIQHADGQVSWEPGPNRTPHIPAEGTTLDLHWNAPKPDLPSPSPTPP